MIHSAQLTELLAPMPGPVADLATRLVGLVAARPGLSGKVMMGWKSVNFRHPDAGHVCSVFPYTDRVSLYFENGRLLEDAEGLLLGSKLKKGRYIRLYPGDDIPIDAISILLSEAIALFA